MKPPPLPQLEPIELDGYKLDLQFWLTKEYREIGEAAVELPSIIEWLNFELQGFIEVKIRKKAELARAEAKAYFSIKNGDFQRKGYGDKPTEAAVNHAVQLDEEVTKLNEDVAVVSGWVERFINLQKTLQFKLELVRSNEATRRKQIDT